MFAEYLLVDSDVWNRIGHCFVDLMTSTYCTMIAAVAAVGVVAVVLAVVAVVVAVAVVGGAVYAAALDSSTDQCDFVCEK